MPPFYGDWLQSVYVVFLFYFLVLCYFKPARLLKYCIMQRMSLELIISAHVSFNTCSLCLWSQTLPPLGPSHPTSLSCFIPGRPLLFLFHLFHQPFSFSSAWFRSGALVDWVQLPDVDGAGAERKPQRDGGGPLHTTWLSAKMEGGSICHMCVR